MPIDERQMNPESERLSGKVVLASMVGVWLCYFLLITLRSVVVGLDFQDELLWRRALVCAIGVAVTGLLWLVLRVVENRALGIKIAVALIAAMPGAMMIAQANRWIFDSIEAIADAKAEIMNGAFEHLISPIYRYEGTVARLMGDAILAFFGAPIAHEDDLQRAVLR